MKRTTTRRRRGSTALRVSDFLASAALWFERDKEKEQVDEDEAAATASVRGPWEIKEAGAVFNNNSSILFFFFFFLYLLVTVYPQR